jgi:hypothetical protein
LPTGVPIESAFHSVMEDTLNERSGSVRYEFINFACGLYLPKHLLATLRERALAYDPDLVLVTATRLSSPRFSSAFDPSDDTSPGAIDAEGLLEFRPTHPFFQSFFLRLVEIRSRKEWHVPRPRVGIVERVVMDLAQRWSPTDDDAEVVVLTSAEMRRSRRAARRATGRVLQGLHEISEKAGVPIVLVRLEYDGSTDLPSDAAIQEEARQLGIRFFDTRTGFIGTRPRSFWIHGLDPHPNAAAHAIFAREIAGFLSSRDLLTPKSRS